MPDSTLETSISYDPLVARRVAFALVIVGASCGGRVTDTDSASEAGLTTDGASKGNLDAAAPLPLDYKILFRAPQTSTITVWHSKTGQTTDIGIPYSDQAPVCTYDGRYFAVQYAHDGATGTNVYDATGALVRTQGPYGSPFAIRPDGAAMLVYAGGPCFMQLLADGSSTTAGCFDSSQDSLVPTAYSPDGAHILWSHGKEVPSAPSAWGGQVVVSTIDGDERQTIVPPWTLDDGGWPTADTIFHSPSFSFDGSAIAGTSTIWGAYLSFAGNLRIVDVHTLTVSNVFPKNDRFVDSPHFTPDGKNLVFTEPDPQNAPWYAIRVVELATLNVQTIVSSASFDFPNTFCLTRDLD